MSQEHTEPITLRLMPLVGGKSVGPRLYEALESTESRVIEARYGLWGKRTELTETGKRICFYAYPGTVVTVSNRSDATPSEAPVTIRGFTEDQLTTTRNSLQQFLNELKVGKKGRRHWEEV